MGAMSYEERPVVFECAGESLVGVISVPGSVQVSAAVLIVVGGPQYRAGSHRQFVLLARHLASRGIPCMRYDYRSMGDSTGDRRDFSAIDDDIKCAMDAMFSSISGVRRVVLWGLCDAASAACFVAPKDRRITGLVLLNPWVRTEAGEAKTYLKSYYARRFLQLRFWKKLLGGGVSIRRSVTDLLTAFRRAWSPQVAERRARSEDDESLPDRMVAGLRTAAVPALFILSGRDYVADEFEDLVRANAEWASLLDSSDVRRLEDADHTFSRAVWRDAVAEFTEKWIIATQTE